MWLGLYTGKSVNVVAGLGLLEGVSCMHSDSSGSFGIKTRASVGLGIGLVHEWLRRGVSVLTLIVHIFG
jgi:hypothetical protein